MKKWKMVATKVLGIGSEVKIIDPERSRTRITRTVVSIDSDLTKKGRREATGITLDDDSTVSRSEIEFCLDASRSK